MHELSLARNIIHAALQAEGITADNLRALNINCGVLSGVNVESLKFCLQLVCEQRNLEGVSAHINEIPVELQCVCGCCYNAQSVFIKCPECGSADQHVTGGADALLESVEIADG